MRKLLWAVSMLAALTLSGCGYNEFQTKDEQVNAAWQEVLNQYKRRADLIPNLVATVQGYAAQAREARLGAGEARGRGLAQRYDQPRADEVDLAVEVGRARGRLLVRGRAVAGRAALHHVGDVDLAAALAADRGEHAVQQLARLAHEGVALLVLLGARTLAHEEPRRRFGTDPEHGLLALAA